MTVDFKKYSGQNVMIHSCNPSFLGGGDWEDQGWRPVLGKNVRPN
jgi:hypothetical protein